MADRAGRYVVPRPVQVSTHGRVGMTLGPGEIWTSVMLPVTPGTTYQWSFDVRVLDGAGTVFRADGLTTCIGKNGIENPVYGMSDVTASPEWARHGVRIRIPADAIPWMYLRLISFQPEDQPSVVVDAMRFSPVGEEAQGVLPFVPARNVEASLATPQSPFSIFER